IGCHVVTLDVPPPATEYGIEMSAHGPASPSCRVVPSEPSPTRHGPDRWRALDREASADVDRRGGIRERGTPEGGHADHRRMDREPSEELRPFGVATHRPAHWTRNLEGIFGQRGSDLEAGNGLALPLGRQTEARGNDQNVGAVRVCSARGGV